MFLTPNAVSVNGAPAGVVVVGATGDEPGLEIIDGRWIEQNGRGRHRHRTRRTLARRRLRRRRTLVHGGRRHRGGDLGHRHRRAVHHPRRSARRLRETGQHRHRGRHRPATGRSTTCRPVWPWSTATAAFEDVLSRTADAKRSIDSFKITLWVLAVVIVAAVLYLAALDRVRDFAVFKATGASNTRPRPRPQPAGGVRRVDVGGVRDRARPR